MTTPSPIDAMAAIEPVDAPDLTGGDPQDGGAPLDEMPLPSGCPVLPLGVNGKIYYFLDWLGQIQECTSKLDKGELYALCGEQLAWLDTAFPMLDEAGRAKPKKFNQDHAQRGFIIACQRSGLFDRRDCERGRGSHRGPGGELVLHCGDGLLIAGAKGVRAGAIKPPHWKRTGKYGEMIFPTGKKIQKPAKLAATRAEMWDLLIDHFNSWNWTGPTVVDFDGVPEERCNVHAYLLFCWSQMAKIPGAMHVRPSLWVTGPTSAGKSGVHETLRSHIGPGWHLATKDMTAAWATQTLQQDRIAVLFDEAEPDAQASTDYHRQILNMAKLAYDGSSKGRGGADGKATTTEIVSCFQFSSVMLPSMKPEDRNRMIIVEVDKFPAGTPPYTEPKMVRELGPKASARLVEQWARFDATLAAYRGAMMARNWSAREANTYGTVLACGDLALFDETPDPTGERIAHLIDCIQPMLVSSRLEGEDHPELCVHHLVSTRLPSASGQMQETVAQWIIKGLVEGVTTALSHAVDKKLQSHGLRLVGLIEGHDRGNGQGGMRQIGEKDWRDSYLAVAGKHNLGTREIFKGSAFGDGGWTKALERLKFKVLDGDGAEIGVIPAIKNKRSRFSGGSDGACVLVPVRALIDLEAAAEAIEAERLAASGGGGR